MRKLLLIVPILAAVCLIGRAAQQEEEQAQQVPAGLNIVVYQGQDPVIVHLHGASGDVHIWVVKEPPPGAAVNPVEQKKLEQLRKLIPAK